MKENLEIEPPIPEAERPGRMLRGARLRAGLTLEDLSRRIGSTAAQLREYENNLTPIPEPTARALAATLETVPGHFLARLP